MHHGHMHVDYIPSVIPRFALGSTNDRPLVSFCQSILVHPVRTLASGPLHLAAKTHTSHKSHKAYDEKRFDKLPPPQTPMSSSDAWPLLVPIKRNAASTNAHLRTLVASI
ncbi:hypothetical protein AMTRI_Chr11g153150 [Amborella trichopoda]|uniref:Uncharacterized protein n=1 Tax=Amborella trichopoda TaxID=13333 RepID=W1NW33_AMBTC|nr:hypothetical protein AMTR_s00114p00044770 [Amborella trichopoda]